MTFSQVHPSFPSFRLATISAAQRCQLESGLKHLLGQQDAFVLGMLGSQAKLCLSLCYEPLPLILLCCCCARGADVHCVVLRLGKDCWVYECGL